MSYITCNRGGTHAGQVEPASTIELPVSRIEALQAERHSTGSLETFAQFFLHWAWLKTRCPKRCSRPALIVFAHAYSWPLVCLRHVRGGLEIISNKLSITALALSGPSRIQLISLQFLRSAFSTSGSLVHGV